MEIFFNDQKIKLNWLGRTAKKAVEFFSKEKEEIVVRNNKKKKKGGRKYKQPSRLNVVEYYEHMTLILDGVPKVKCHYCNTWTHIDDITRDHIIPSSKGGNSFQRNIVACCSVCNGKKGDMSYEKFMKTLIEDQILK